MQSNSQESDLSLINVLGRKLGFLIVFEFLVGDGGHLCGSLIYAAKCSGVPESESEIIILFYSDAAALVSVQVGNFQEVSQVAGPMKVL